MSKNSPASFLSCLPWLLAAAVCLSGCGNATTVSATATTANLQKAPWSSVLSQAKGNQVYLYMWGGSASINHWIDTYAAPQLLKQYGITLKRVPVANTSDIINLLLSEKGARNHPGVADLIWINGENFKAAQDGKLLWGPITSSLPNFNAYFDVNSPTVTSDFGYPVKGYEAPWGRAQLVMTYNSRLVSNPPRSFAALAKWVRAHPGQFTYPAPNTDFTGSAFLRMALYATTGGYRQYLGAYDQKKLEAKWGATWTYLQALKPYLWRQGTTYPASSTQLNALYASGEVTMTMSYDPNEASSQMAKGLYPPTTRTYLLDSGTIANTHFLAIPFNAPHKAAALAAINFFESPAAQLSKFNPKNWGDFPAIDPAKVPPSFRASFQNMNLGPATLPPAVLAAHQVPEIAAGYVTALQNGWVSHVAQGN